MPEFALKWDGVKLAGTADSQTADVTYIVFDADDEPAAIAYVLANAPTTYSGIPITDMATADRLSERSWLVTVKFSTKVNDQKKEAKTAGGTEPVVGQNYEIEFSAECATETITKSLETLQVVMTAETLVNSKGETVTPTETDFKGNIQDDGEEVKGCEFPPPAHFQWTETHYIKNASVTDEYVRTLEEMLGMVNDQTFRQRDPGCVLFRKFSGKRKDTTSYAFSFTFESRRPTINETLPDPENYPHFVGVNAAGYDFLWFSRIKIVRQGEKRLTQVAVQLNVEKVAVRGDFTELGIGVAGLDP